MRILIAEDDDPKLSRIRETIAAKYPTALISPAASANSALASLRARTPNLLILDMSLPTFEIARGEPGGRPQDFGGLEVMDHMDLEGIVCPTIVVTQHEEFPVANGESMSRLQVAATAAREHPDTFVGLIYYRSVADDWESELAEMADRILSGRDE